MELSLWMPTKDHFPLAFLYGECKRDTKERPCWGETTRKRLNWRRKYQFRGWNWWEDEIRRWVGKNSHVQCGVVLVISILVFSFLGLPLGALGDGDNDVSGKLDCQVSTLKNPHLARWGVPWLSLFWKNSNDQWFFCLYKQLKNACPRAAWGW